MTDRELLEAAARAAGVHITGEWAGHQHYSPKWNPLTDDGDALRLAVAMRITPHIDSNMTEAEAMTHELDGFFTEPHLTDPYAATRRAIVRAAAAMAAP